MGVILVNLRYKASAVLIEHASHIRDGFPDEIIRITVSSGAIHRGYGNDQSSQWMAVYVLVPVIVVKDDEGLVPDTDVTYQVVIPHKGSIIYEPSVLIR